jgi:hypothetical protein
VKVSYANRIRSRIAEIEAILASRDKLREELDELRVAERVLSRLSSEAEDDAAFVGSDPKPKANSAMTTRDHILAVLLDAPELWLTTHEVQGRASQKIGRDIPHGTIAPTLSELKKSGRIVRDGLKVAHAQRLKTNEAPARAEAPNNPARDERGTSLPQSSDASTSQQNTGGIFD